MRAIRKPFDWSKVIAAVLGTLMLAAFFGLIVGINWLRAGGDWGCVISQDPAICVAIKESGR